MVEIIAIAAVVLAVTVAIVLALAATKPASFSVRRAALVKAAPEKIFSLINDFHQWGSWSPYEHKDPAMNAAIAERQPAGARCMRGTATTMLAPAAWKSWTARRLPKSSSSSISSGRSRATTPPSSQCCRRAVPPIATDDTDVTTNVTWLMHGPAPFMSRLMQVFMNIDHMIGKDFEVGLANLKRLTEQ